MYRQPSKKRQLTERVIVSIVTTVSVLIIVTATVLFLLGYRLDSDNGRLEQGALLQFDSAPAGATVWIDGKNTGSRTATKRTILAGTHAFTMTRAGYEDWNKTLDVSAGTLTWLDYIRLVPKERPVEAVSSYSSLVAMKAAPDMRTLIAQERADQPTFQLIDIRAADVRSTSLTLPSDVYTDSKTAGVTHSFALHQWDRGSRYVLVTHTFSGQTEWLVVDTANVALSKNITRILGTAFQKVAFIGTDGAQFYGLAADGILRKIDLTNATLSRALLSHVSQFSIAPVTSIVGYVGTDPADATKRVVGVYREGDATGHVLKTVESTDVPLMIATGRYFSDDLVAIAEGGTLTVLKGSYPTSSQAEVTSLQTLDTISLPGPVTNLSFSPKAAYVVAQSGSDLVSYEFEHRRATAGKIVTSGQTPSLQWLDDAHLWGSGANSLTMRDFDGTNVFSIMPAADGFDATLSQNGRYMYGVALYDGVYKLQRVTMILE